MAQWPAPSKKSFSHCRTALSAQAARITAISAILLLLIFSFDAQAQAFPPAGPSGSCRVGELRKSYSTIPTVVRFERLFFSLDWNGEALLERSIRMLGGTDQVIQAPVKIQFRTQLKPSGQVQREMTATVYNKFTDQEDTATIVSTDDFEFTWHSPNASTAKLGDTLAIWIYCFMNIENDTAGVDIDDLLRRRPWSEIAPQ